MSSVSGSTQIALGDISALCESLVVQTDTGGDIKGMVFGCEGFAYQCQNMEFNNDNFEFQITNGRLIFENIYKPLNLPVITPRA